MAPLALSLELPLLVFELPSVPAAAGTSGQIQYSSQGPVISTPGNASVNITGMVNMQITDGFFRSVPPDASLTFFRMFCARG